MFTNTFIINSQVDLLDFTIFDVMERPVEPLESDCCNSGCNPCILDVYEAQLAKYKKSLLSGSNFSKTNEINAINSIFYTNFTLSDRKQLSLNHLELKFVYSDQKQPKPNCLKYTNGQHFLLKGKDSEGDFTRAFTPVWGGENGDLSFKIVVKLYLWGTMSKILKRMQIGAVTAWRGPYGDFKLDLSYKYLVFIAQGTGIAPIYAVVREILQNEACESFIKLFYCCKNGEDVLFRNEIYEFANYWNFDYEIYLSDIENDFEAKYKEVVHDKKLDIEDLAGYFENKSGIRVSVCGSTDFSAHLAEKITNLAKKIDIFVF